MNCTGWIIVFTEGQLIVAVSVSAQWLPCFGNMSYQLVVYPACNSASYS